MAIRLNGLQIHQIIVSDIGGQRIVGHLKEGNLEEALADSRTHRMKEEQVTRAVLKGIAYLVKDGRDDEAINAAFAFNITERQLADLKLPERFNGELRTAISLKGAGPRQ